VILALHTDCNVKVFNCGMQGSESSEDGSADSGSEARTAAAGIHDATGCAGETRSA